MSQPANKLPGNLQEPTVSVSNDRDSDETIESPYSKDAESSNTFSPPVVQGEVGTLGPYRILKQLGHGGMGAVYLAFDTRLNRKLALKMMLPRFAANAAAKERFLREARVAAQISHDNIVTIYEADERNGFPFIAMQYLQGYPLDEYLRKKGNPSITQILHIARETALGLAEAHHHGLVHRDIKPANVWLEAPNGRVKILDFGLAKPVDAEVELTKSGAVVGTPAYMSPEQGRGLKVDHRTDLFSLGALLYRLCTGKLPFTGPTTMATLMALGTEESTPVRVLNPQIPEPLAVLVHQLLAKNPIDRPQTASEVAYRIETITKELTASTSPAVANPSVPQVIYVPLEITVQPQSTPFDDLEETIAHPSVMKPIAAANPVRKMPGGKGAWIAAGSAAFLAIIALVVIIIIKNKDGTETKIEAPDGATVTIKNKDGKTTVKVKPESKQATPTPDRSAAEHFLSLGGWVKVNGEETPIKVAVELPKDQFTITGVLLQNLNNVSDADLGHLNECKNLEVLNLWKTKASDKGMDYFKGCRNLKELNLAYTKVTDAGLAVFKGSNKLTWLNLSDTQVTDKGLTHFNSCVSLALLWLANTQTTDAGLASFKGCKNLVNLNLTGTRITNVGLTNFTDCKNLITLAIESTAVSDEGLTNFKNCKNLTYLSIAHTRATDEGLVYFKDCKQLMELWLAETQVTDAGLTHFKDCKSLTLLNIQKTKITPGFINEFHKALPQCKIEHDNGTIQPE